MRLSSHYVIWLSGVMALAGCAAPGFRVPPGATAPLYEQIGSHRRTITTRSADAQRYFNQGLTWAYAFNHDEAIRAFEQAAALDPQCGMAWWGVALCHGPHVNNPIVPEPRARAAWEAVQKAQALKANATPVEQALIDAVAKRYAADPAAERRPLDEAYAAAMGEVWKRFPQDSDVGTLYAEALMDLQPWDYWGAGGAPKGRIEEVLAVLESVLAIDPNNPGANHLYIHAVEASPFPEKGIAAADRLRRSVPIAGHLVHMPSHIDVQVGRWSQAADTNEAAIRSDERYRAITPKQNFYRVYMAHNHHFLSFAAMMSGRSATALRAAREMLAGIPADFARENAPLVDPFLSAELDVLMRFGRWEEILLKPQPAPDFPITVALWHYKRGVALAALGRLDEAAVEQRAFAEARARVPADALMGINRAHTILDIAERVLTGEIALRRGDLDAAIRELRAAVAIEDSLLYMEPPEWVQPVRHTLGAVLVKAQRWAEAEAVYRDDLKVWPENGWSLFGLAQCLRARGATEEARAVQKRFETTWARADIEIPSTCLCVTRADLERAGALDACCVAVAP